MALQGIKVLEIFNSPPVSICTTYLSDFGATVTRITRPLDKRPDFTADGKLNIALNLKHPSAHSLILKLSQTVDILIENLRPGKMEELNMGPGDLLKENPRLIYVRYSGFGQTGPYALKSGHDGSFAALSGVLPLLADRNHSAQYPGILLTAASGALSCAYGILAAVIARERTGRGQVLEHSTIDAIAYSASFLFRLKDSPYFFEKGRRTYKMDIYKTKDHQFMSVCSEESYLDHLFNVLEIDPEETKRLDNDAMADKLQEKFSGRTRSEWVEIFKDIDVCVFPVLNAEEAAENRHNKERGTFSRRGDQVIPNPTPRLSETPADSCGLRKAVDKRIQLDRAMGQIGVGNEEIERLIKEGVVYL